LTRNFDLGDEVWWFETSDEAQVRLRSGKIHGMRWYRAYMRKRKFFCIDFEAIPVANLYKSKADALRFMIERCGKELVDAPSPPG
jgi:hypothetical protein